ncbi:Response regulator protein VraR [Fundidesulfovibrio magnetotacticus]|uniref:Response regulator protein VraR n=1 Tax=Fundidesulfovibrio magnetotacticus TaxID=2730080 RepID=A0A6V8LVP2_9BACT|nr:response regulator transcription factor [Fundidesulfovibrio magnetotacticus]GFK94159.1 Response regulator protein VraR [Fundidesulfovibrio magnetotacticus]
MGREPLLRVLLAEDVPVLRLGIRMLLAGFPDIVVAGEAADGREAVDKALELKPDAVIMDLSMPVLDGLEAIALIRPLLPGTGILALTGHEDPALVRAALEAGAHGFLLKDAQPQELAQGVRAVARGQRFVPQRLAARLQGG